MNRPHVAAAQSISHKRGSFTKPRKPRIKKIKIMSRVGTAADNHIAKNLFGHSAKGLLAERKDSGWFMCYVLYKE